MLIVPRRDKPENRNYNGTNITYDASGNPRKWRNADDIEWLESAGKQMSLIYDGDQGLYMYEYNIDNIRTKKTVYGEQGIDFLYESQYILNGTSIVRETRTYADGSVIILDFLYDDSGVMLGVVYNGTTYYYRKNLGGYVTGIVNSSGTVVVSYTYDAWGNPVSVTGSMASTLGEINPIRYRGYYYDTETGFYYLQSRYYDPVVGRFVSADSTDFLGVTGTTLSFNLFAYCENNAVNNADEYGYFKIPTWLACSALDLMLMVMNPYAQISVTAVSFSISVLLTGKFTKNIAKKLLFSIVPTVKGLFSATFTILRTVIYRLAGVTLHFFSDYMVEKFFSKDNIINAFIFIDNVLSPSFAGWYTCFLDYLDGDLDGMICIGQ